MQCLLPITILKKEGTPSFLSRTRKVPCGKCPNCLKNRALAWMFRLQQHQKISQSADFLTLTYDDENLPFTENGLMTLEKRDITLFNKKLRKYVAEKYPENPPLKYYQVGEYGGQTSRPHYHSIMFNLPRGIGKQQYLGSIWAKGLISADECNARTIAYVTQYLQKTPPWNPDPDDDRTRYFSSMSKGLGVSFLTPQMINYYQSHMIPYIVGQDGQKLIMPRYFKEKIYTDEQKRSLGYIAEYNALNKEFEFESFQHEADYIYDRLNRFERWRREREFLKLHL